MPIFIYNWFGINYKTKQLLTGNRNYFTRGLALTFCHLQYSYRLNAIENHTLLFGRTTYDQVQSDMMDILHPPIEP